MKILVSTHHLYEYAGSEIFTYVLSRELTKRGHDVTVYCGYIGKWQNEFEKLGIRAVDNLDSIKDTEFDVGHVHHFTNIMEVRHSFPNLPLVLVIHGVIPSFEQPPIINLELSQIVAVSEGIADHLVSLGIPRESIQIIRNPIDETLFYPQSPIFDVPTRALIISNHLPEEMMDIIQQACEAREIQVEKIGLPEKSVPWSELPHHINNADIVFTLGRGAVESMFFGRIPIIYDYNGGDGMVTPENYDDLKQHSFSGRLHRKQYSVDDLLNQIDLYKKENGEVLRSKAQADYNQASIVDQFVDVYRKIRDFDVPDLHESDQHKLNTLVDLFSQCRNYEQREVEWKIEEHQQLLKAKEQLNQIRDSKFYKGWRIYSYLKKLFNR